MSGRLLRAFRDIMFERGYNRLTVRELIVRAGIARSTFYEYFDDKSDVLRLSVQPFLAVLATCAVADRPSATIASVLEHFQRNRNLALAMGKGEARELMMTFLAEEIERCFNETARTADARAELPTSLVAYQIAGAQLALIDAWLRKPQPPSATAIAAALFQTSHAMATALLHA